MWDKDLRNHGRGTCSTKGWEAMLFFETKVSTREVVPSLHPIIFASVFLHHLKLFNSIPPFIANAGNSKEGEGKIYHMLPLS